ncbi:MAG: S1 RNA-binding domain-containing protein [Solobacterium sp.]|nr:S1 RNA-binding domain-containing protein [Solobacterium sp.]
MNKYYAGQIVEGRVTGIQPYGAFIALDKENNGLIHISEISDGFVKDIHRFVRVGEYVRIKVIEYDPNTKHAKLSLKAAQRLHLRNRRKSTIQEPSIPTMRLGFQTIVQNLDKWIAEAKEKKYNDEI